MIIFVSVWAIVANWFAYRRGFYAFPKTKQQGIFAPSTIQLIVAYGIYLALALVLAPIFARFILLSWHKANPDINVLPILLITAVQFTSMAAIFLFLQLYFAKQDRELLRCIWNDPKRPKQTPVEFNLGLGAAAWFLSFPLVTVVSEFIDYLLKTQLGLTSYEQTAVKFVKAAMGSPLSIVFALLSVLVLAPFIEEFLFRGVLMTYIKKKIGAGGAILSSALFFALFHYSPSQGLGNISLVISLFILGVYLGFLYHKQGSLWAPIGLHMAFNLISAIRILILPESA